MFQPKNPKGIGGGHFRDSLKGNPFHLGDFLGRVSDVTGLIPLSPQWDRRQEGGIRLNQKGIERKLSDQSLEILPRS